MGSQERTTLPRFRHLFESHNAGGEGEAVTMPPLPANVFLMALELQPFETINGKALPYDGEVLVLRDNLVATYKPLVNKIRQLHSKEIDCLPQNLLARFGKAWHFWEGAWLRNREAHAVEALQPLVGAILSLEPLLLSVEKE